MSLPLRRPPIRPISGILILVSGVLFFLTLDLTRREIGKPFPGYLTFKNGVVAAFYVPGWSGPREGLTYHARPATEKKSTEIFSGRDYLLVVLLPAFSGLLFILIGAGLCSYLPDDAGRLPLLLFHFLVGNYLILSPEFQLTWRSSYLFLGLFAFIPAPMIHFALLFPERERFAARHPALYFAPYLLSLLALTPYLYLFMRAPALWIVVEYVAFFYAIGGYLFWLARLLRTLRRPQLEFNRIIARYLLLGQIAAFIVPLGAAAAVFVGGISFPLNLATPLTLLFPTALFMGVILGRLGQSRMQLVQLERRAAVGNLLAGLSHEINNPMTFIYSAIEPLRESLDTIRKMVADEKISNALNDADQLVGVVEEGAERTKSIIDNFRRFSWGGSGEMQETQINEVIDQSVRLLAPKWKDRIAVVQKPGKIPKIKCLPAEMGQVFVNILANACEAIPGEGTIEIVTERLSSRIQIIIRDTGQGMSKEIVSRIFDPFYTTKGQGEGTGLGLAVTLEIVKRHRGTIDVKSERGRGTEFVITLPTC